MVKKRKILPESSTIKRYSPYPLRSCRIKKEKEAESILESESVSTWEDVRCLICMEPPHNAVILQCSSFFKGCRAYMCDTSARHSNCFKQYCRTHKKNTIYSNDKILKCPYCRGEVYRTMKSTRQRRLLNAKHRFCSMEKCNFSGTYTQLKNHLKGEHRSYISPKLNSFEEHNINDPQRWITEHNLLLNSLHNALMRDLLVGARSEAAANYPAHIAPLDPRRTP